MAAMGSLGGDSYTLRCISDLPPPFRPVFGFRCGIQTAITILKGFASQLSSHQADKARLQEEVLSTTLKLDQAVTMAATARQNADSLKRKLDQLKKLKVEAQARRKEREDLLHKSTLALLEAADIHASSVGKSPVDSSADALSLAIKSGDLVRALLKKNKAVMSRLHAMIFPKANQENILGKLTDTFFVDTEGTIEVFKRGSCTFFWEWEREERQQRLLEEAVRHHAPSHANDLTPRCQAGARLAAVQPRPWRRDSHPREAGPVASAWP
ncbi:hypothetical protein QYE76_068094 [Lolium multiflorum]|uniref:Uncharacterized protein n=1 Tax=Lolium multiflorum TaxID=4521 RepID=A0AAD8SEL5_LOLMU|nr:hypothetical protein QYE76_068094 [Lolium multiflorum]